MAMPDNLTDFQLAAATAPIDHPLLILAAAGSGKTLVLCHRIIHLLNQGVPAKDILALTFTRRAAKDLLQRLQAIQSTSSTKSCLERMRIGTFHSFSLSLLRSFPSQAGLAPNFIIFTPKMELELLEDLVKEWYMQREEQRQMHETVHGVQNLSSEQKGLFKSEAYSLMKQFRKLHCGFHQDIINNGSNDMLKWVHRNYLSYLQKINAIDFNDFIRYTISLLKTYPSALESLGFNVRYVLVDEFQDTDVGQFELLRVLCHHHQQLTIVGDDDQQIYSWRGAAGFKNLSLFQNFFPGATIIKLERNFRSTGAIVAAARFIIAKNQNRLPKTIRTKAPTGELLTICECRNEQCEARAVADFILSKKHQGVPFNEMVVLYRLHRVGLELQHNLKDRGIPCEISSLGSGDDGISMGISKGDLATGGAFNDIICVIRLILNEDDDVACGRLLEAICPNLDVSLMASLRHLQDYAHMPLLHALKLVRSHLLKISVCEHLSAFEPAQMLARRLQNIQGALEGMHDILRIVASAKKEAQVLCMKDIIRNLLQQIAPYREEARNYDLTSLNVGFDSKTETILLKQRSRLPSKYEFSGIKALLREATLFDTDIRPSFANSKSSKQASYKDMKRQRSASSTTMSGSSSNDSGNRRLSLFMDRLATRLHDEDLDGKFETYGESQLNVAEHKNVVTLCTIHQAKGLEWTSVIFARANEGIIPVMEHDTNIGRSYQAQIEIPSLIDDKQGPSYAPIVDGSLEEERRLMYVMLTRARSSLFITYLVTSGGQKIIPSRFLTDIPAGLARKVVCYDSSTKPMVDNGCELTRQISCQPQVASLMESDSMNLSCQETNSSQIQKIQRTRLKRARPNPISSEGQQYNDPDFE